MGEGDSEAHQQGSGHYTPAAMIVKHRFESIEPAALHLLRPPLSLMTRPPAGVCAFSTMADSGDDAASAKAYTQADMECLIAVAARPYPARRTIMGRMKALQAAPERHTDFFGIEEYAWAKTLYECV